MLLDNLTLLLRIVEKGGLAAAGRELGLSPATVSERLAALEAHYSARLLTRTTRSLSLTEEGRVLVEGARRLLAEAEELEARLRHGSETLSGTIRLSAPFDLGRNRIVPMIDRFMDAHPQLRIELALTDGYLDLAAQGIDLAFRFGALKDSALYQRKLGTNHRIVCAAPAYLERHGTPLTPGDLAGHDCILMRFGENIDQEWPFVVEGKPMTQIVRGRRVANDGSLVKDWCLRGHGIALKSGWDVSEHLAKGELVAILADFAPPPTSLQIVYTGGPNLPRRIRSLMDYFAQNWPRDRLNYDGAR